MDLSQPFLQFQARPWRLPSPTRRRTAANSTSETCSAARRTASSLWTPRTTTPSSSRPTRTSKTFQFRLCTLEQLSRNTEVIEGTIKLNLFAYQTINLSWCWCNIVWRDSTKFRQQVCEITRDKDETFLLAYPILKDKRNRNKKVISFLHNWSF